MRRQIKNRDAGRVRVVVFASGGGGNFKYLAQNLDRTKFRIQSLVVDRPCGAEAVADDHGIPIVKLILKNQKANFDDLFNTAKVVDSDLIVLAGFMPIVPARFINNYSGLILNTHPSLLPSHGGKGMYGVKVQESVIQRGDVVAGCTCHIVDAGIDTGPIVSQRKIPVDPELSAWQLGGKVFEIEGPNLIDAIEIVEQKRSVDEA
jgi:phosphoribosylglycinamide formyltransferase 1